MDPKYGNLSLIDYIGHRSKYQCPVRFDAKICKFARPSFRATLGAGYTACTVQIVLDLWEKLELGANPSLTLPNW